MSTGRVARHCLLISLPMVRSIHIHPVRTGHHCTAIRNISTITMNCLLPSPRVTAIYVDTTNRICFFTICHYTNDNRSPPLSLFPHWHFVLTLFSSLGHVFNIPPFPYLFYIIIRNTYIFIFLYVATVPCEYSIFFFFGNSYEIQMWNPFFFLITRISWNLMKISFFSSLLYIHIYIYICT